LSKLLVEELKLRLDKQWNTKQTIEDKAKNVIATSSTVTSLIFGFVTFSSSVFQFEFPIYLSITVTSSIIANVFSILLSILALRIETYKTPFTIGSLSASNLSNIKRLTEGELINNLIKVYSGCIIHNEKKNQSKSRKITYATYSLLVGIVLIGAATGVILFLFQTSFDGLQLTISRQPSIDDSATFSPQLFVAEAGSTIIVKNDDYLIHSVTSGNGPDDTNKKQLFDTKIINPHESSKIIVANLPPGEYHFFCSIYPNMTGILKVIEREE
jgi:plastocyanin